mmetsp:Transcript_33865/g.24900  ORF Transcript_33865/g.24900 Transcript_33865/m.24900 type:complete len:176 (+) Transcript_33865:250-777(+)
MKKWKLHVSYKKVKRGYNSSQLHYSADHIKHTHPGQINNEPLLKPFDKYWREDNNQDPTNFVVRSKIREGYDYKLLPKDCWEPLVEKYGGFEIKRTKDTQFYSRRYVIRFPSIPILVLPPYDKLNSDELPMKLKIFMQPDQKFREVKEKLVRILNKHYEEERLSISSLRLWKASY